MNIVDTADPMKKTASLERGIIQHPQFKNALDLLNEQHKLSVSSQQSHGMMVLGASGVGKSTLLQTFLKQHPIHETDEETRIPVLSVEIPSQPTIKSTADAILGKFDEKYKGGTAETKTKKIIMLIKHCDVKTIILDEFQHFSDRGRKKTNALVADWLKSLMNNAGVSFVVFGLPQAAEILRSNEQLRRRFSASVTLVPWSMSSESDMKEFRGVIKILEKSADLPASSELYENDLYKRLYFASGGKIGYLSKLIDSATYIALQDGDSHIERSHLHKAFQKSVWADAPKNLNPFDDDFEWRQLNGACEPFEPALI
ncbi:MAG: TniB family NTP-binding protein [Moraxellaceae bacterium]